jgi:hypothetical protein
MEDKYVSDNINMNITDTGFYSVKWIQLAQGGVK